VVFWVVGRAEGGRDEWDHLFRFGMMSHNWKDVLFDKLQKRLGMTSGGACSFALAGSHIKPDEVTCFLMGCSCLFGWTLGSFCLQKEGQRFSNTCYRQFPFESEESLNFIFFLAVVAHEAFAVFCSEAFEQGGMPCCEGGAKTMTCGLWARHGVEQFENIVTEAMLRPLKAAEAKWWSVWWCDHSRPRGPSSGGGFELVVFSI